MLVLVLRTLMIYLLIVAAMRLMGKRQLGELQPSELVSTILISNLASISIESPEVPLAASLAPVCLIVVLELFSSALCYMSPTAAKLLSGTPVAVIRGGKIDQKMYTELITEHPIDLCRYQVANNYMGRIGLINSGGESHGASDLKDAVYTAVVNKRAGGMGLISGRKAFQRPMKDGVELLHTIQDVYLDPGITIA